MFIIIVVSALYSVFVLANIFCIAFAVEKNSFLVKCSKLPVPKDLAYLVFSLGITVFCFLEIVTRLIMTYLKTKDVFKLIEIWNCLIYFMSSIVSLLIVGIATQHFCIRALEANHTVTPATVQDCLNPLVKEFQNLKLGLGPQLFLLFFIRSIFIISYTYRMFVGNGIIVLFYLTWVANELVVFGYLAHVVDDTYKVFKNTSQTLK